MAIPKCAVHTFPGIKFSPNLTFFNLFYIQFRLFLLIFTDIYQEIELTLISVGFLGVGFEVG